MDSYLANTSKNWQSKVRLASFLRGNASNHVGAIRKSFRDVESPLIEFQDTYS